ncbi:hypothetical protein DFP72DRAFT_1102075 [Ephemerocybe angulata]|uniref:Uncharacterized protein n=1 Tax=Ephemerocybe angulata TaxID=980116 RepID=A0A8H6HC91_9AGAR|nr:hypothetical protein DFP72DRAFT_1102075 [Tulosesus angulatus]
MEADIVNTRVKNVCRRTMAIAAGTKEEGVNIGFNWSVAVPAWAVILSDFVALGTLDTSVHFYKMPRAPRRAARPPSRTPAQQAQGSVAHERRRAGGYGGRDLVPGDVRIEYSPSLKRKAEYYRRDEYEEHRQKKGRSEGASTRVGADAPWHPFKTRTDFDFAELMFKGGLSKDQIASLLAIIRRCAEGDDILTFRGYPDLQSSWEEARHLVEPFVECYIQEPFDGETLTYDFYYRSLWQWGASCAKNAQLSNYFEWNAQTVHAWDGEAWDRVYVDPWTGDDWAKVEEGLPAGGVPLMFILYADKTILSSFGTAKGYPVYAKLANLPAHITNGTGLGGGRLVGWLPVVKDDPKHKGNPEWVDFKKVIWHACFRQMFESIKEYSKDGCWVRCGDGVERHLFPRILILAADYEEQVVMAATRGIGTAHPCPVCLVHKDDLATYADQWELRDHIMRHTLALAAADRSKSAAARRKALDKLNSQSFPTDDNSDPHRILSFDRLHNYPGGLAKTHILGLLFKRLQKKNDKDTKNMKTLIEKRASEFPRWQGLNHFLTILTENAYQDSNKWEDMARVLLFVCHDLFPPTNKKMHQVLRCLRAFLNLNVYSSFERHTETSLGVIEDMLRTFFVEIEKHGKIDRSKDWSAAPKVHMHVHMPRDIRGKGVTMNYSTKTFESMHKPLKGFYMKTNFKNVGPQILQSDIDSTTIKFIRSEIDSYDKEIERLKRGEGDDDPTPDEPHKFAFDNVTLKSPTSSKGYKFSNFTFDAEATAGPYKSALSLFDFGVEIGDFLQQNSNETPHSTRSSTLRIQAFRSVEVTYTSLETDLPETNIVRCSPSFHGNPRYDSIIINDPDGPLFARLLGLFVLKDGAEDRGVPIALILPYDGKVTDAQRRRDERLGFYRVSTQKPRGSAPEFVFARTIVRGTVLVPANELKSEFFVFDVLDADMFLRVQELLKGDSDSEGEETDTESDGPHSDGSNSDESSSSTGGTDYETNDSEVAEDEEEEEEEDDSVD